jgi:hypothetical protein
MSSFKKRIKVKDFDQFQLRLPPGMRATIAAMSADVDASMNALIVHFIQEGMKAKGPAEAATSPSHGSNIPSEETKMNEQVNSTTTDSTPARPLKLLMLDAQNMSDNLMYFCEAAGMAVADISDVNQRSALGMLHILIREKFEELSEHLEMMKEKMA